jgi:transcriptional regulator with XRE-family HTH domain
VECITVQNLTVENLYKTIGTNVAKYRKAKGLSQLDLSLQMGYKSVSIVSGAEICYKGKHFNLEHIVKISEILEVDFCNFFNQTN